MITEGAVREVTRGSSEPAGQDAYFAHVGIASESARNRIGDARVAVLGVGGIGSVVLQHLVGAGVRRYFLLDHDVVDASNLERQFIYTRSDVGAAKVACAARYVRERIPAAAIETNTALLSNREQTNSTLAAAAPIDACVVCIDHPPGSIFEWTAESLWALDVPSLTGGAMARSGFYGPLFVPGVSAYPPSEFAPRNRDRVQPTNVAFGPVNTTIGALMSSQLIHYLVGYHTGVEFDRRTFINFYAETIQTLAPDEVVLRSTALELGP